LALVVLSVVEQRLDAVRAVLAGATVTEVAVEVGVSRQSVHAWTARYLSEGVAGLADRSRRPRVSPTRVPVGVEVAVAELRRQHPRWGAKRIRMELLRKPALLADSDSSSEEEAVADDVASGSSRVPSERTVNRILTRNGLLVSRPRKRARDSFVRWQREAPMQLWGIDIVGGIWLVDPSTGELSEAKVVTGVDDHSRFCVMAQVVARATGRAVCLAFAQALARFGVPEEVLTDNGKQFTDRFGRHGGRNGEVLFDVICRKNGIKHRLTQPASPNQNGKVERFHGTFRPDFLDQVEPFTSIDAAQAAVDAWVADYNAERPHQALDAKLPVTPGDRFVPVEQAQRELIDLWLPPTLQVAAAPDPAVVLDDVNAAKAAESPDEPPETSAPGGPVELDMVVPASGNMSLRGKQFWLGPARAGMTVRFWAGTDVIHLSIAGARIKSVRSHLTVADLTHLAATGAAPAGRPPLPPAQTGDDAGNAVEVDRVVSTAGTIALGGKIVLAAEILAGRRVGIRLEDTTLLFFDLDTRELLRTRPNPLTGEQVQRLRGARPAGPPPRPSTEPVTVQRLASNTGMVSVCGQQIHLGRRYAGRTLTVAVSQTTLAVTLDDADTHVVRRTTTSPVRNIKSRPPRTASIS
jgi:transposase InsO family protein